jgi:hypothetical protein
MLTSVYSRALTRRLKLFGQEAGFEASFAYEQDGNGGCFGECSARSVREMRGNQIKELIVPDGL